MPPVSLRQRLGLIGELSTPNAVARVPGGFHSSPTSLRAAMRAMRGPRIQEWTPLTHQSTFDNRVWTEECQGLTTDGQSAFVASNNADLRVLASAVSHDDAAGGLRGEQITRGRMPGHCLDTDDVIAGSHPAE